MRIKISQINDLLSLYRYYNELSLENKLDVINKAYYDICLLYRKSELINWLDFENKDGNLVTSYEYDILIEKYQTIDKLSLTKLDDLDLEWLYELFTFDAINLLFSLAACNIIKKFNDEYKFETIQKQLSLEIKNANLYYTGDYKIKDFGYGLLNKKLNYQVSNKLKDGLIKVVSSTLGYLNNFSIKDINFSNKAVLEYLVNTKSKDSSYFSENGIEYQYLYNIRETQPKITTDKVLDYSINYLIV